MTKAFRFLRATQTSLELRSLTLKQARFMSSVAINRFSRKGQNSNVLLGIASSLLVPSASVALCEGKDKGFLDNIVKKDKDGNIDFAGSIGQVGGADFWDEIAKASGEKIQSAYDTGIPSQLSYGFVCGYCSGYALKVVGRGAAVVFGLGFMGLQTLSYYGYVNVDHVKIQSDFERALDLNKDGKVDKEDAKIASDKVMEVLQYNLPAGGGFGAGFVAGVRSG